jgi:PKHD-type hydroxylase
MSKVNIIDIGNKNLDPWRSLDQHPQRYDWAWQENVFSVDEIEKILALVTTWTPGTTGFNKVPTSHRVSDVFFINGGDAVQWIYSRIGGCIDKLNALYLGGYLWDNWMQPLQLTRYRGDEHYDWHRDWGNNYPKRKISAIIQLADPTLYDGGHVEFMNDTGKPHPAPRGRGTGIVFPAHVLHRVAPVTRGTRYSLVAWGDGPALK